VLAQKRDINLSVGKVDVLEYNGDEELLIRALSNIVDNAIKFSVPKSNVVVSLARNDGFIHFNVSDEGAGIPKKSLGKIFNRFYRVDGSRSRATGGSGLGLAIAKWIVEMHAGKIQVQSELSKGSTFTIQLPASS
jgi:signal transduction histidine kinase